MSSAPTLAAPGRALCRAPVAPMYDRPNPASVMVSQRLAGHELDLLSADGDWFKARGTDGYEGWMHRAVLSPAPKLGARRSSQIIRVSLGCVTRSAGGERRNLPLGARLGPEEIVRGGEFIEHPQLPLKFPRTAMAITRSAKEYFEGTPYLWGGITPWGADCSGFVQTIYGLHGVHLPRDAKQQAEWGDAVASDKDLAVADLVFFADTPGGPVSHVGISLGQNRIAHCALGRAGYHIENLNDRKDAYVKALVDRFVTIRRVL